VAPLVRDRTWSCVRQHRSRGSRSGRGTSIQPMHRPVPPCADLETVSVPIPAGRRQMRPSRAKGDCRDVGRQTPLDIKAGPNGDDRSRSHSGRAARSSRVVLLTRLRSQASGPTEARKRSCGRRWADRSRRGMGCVAACGPETVALSRATASTRRLVCGARGSVAPGGGAGEFRIVGLEQHFPDSDGIAGRRPEREPR
jgi:hypothetical protein